ncbi:MAG TPA: ABC transporter ATP-binding protein [Thermoanaerobaculia bacterium]|nr:ABC transporter ATP-binding protein [Thermoanaerobaculia bacterium]
MNPPAPVGRLDLEGLSKTFGSTPVLADLSLVVEAGELLTVLGPSGCGKTTLLRLIAGLELPDRGTLRLDGRDITRVPAHQRPVNTVFQSYALFPHLSVAGNVAFGLESRRFPRPEIERRVASALALLELAELAQRWPNELSGGQKQRVALARALVNEPEVLLLDEPMSALDAKLRAQLQLELRRLQRTLSRTFILVTHDQDEAMVVSDRILVMRGGRIEQLGSPREVYERPRTRFVAEFLGAANLIPVTANGSNGHVQAAWGTLAVRERPPWREGLVAIRPERIRVNPERPASSENGFSARVTDAVFRGDCLDLWLAPMPLRVRTPPIEALEPGQQVWIELPVDDLEVLVD